MAELEWMERYDLRSNRERHEGWAVIHIDSLGFLAVVSDFGNYAYHWRSFGGDFKKFLAGVDSSYLYSKLAPKQYIYDGLATAAAIRARIIEVYRTDDRDAAPDEWNLLEHLQSDIESSEFGFYQWYLDTEIESAGETSCSMVEPQCWAFCEKVWPRFVEALREGRSVRVQKEAS